MTHRKLTASGLALAAACPAAYALPAVEDIETDAMRAGTERHAWLDAFALAWESRRAEGGSPAAARADAERALPTDPTARATCEAIDVERLLDLTGAREGRVEVGLRVQWWPATDVAEELALADGHRSYPEAPNALHGTADWVVTAPSGDVTVVDFKGSLRGAPAGEHIQAAFYGLALARARGLDAVTVALVYLDEDGTLTRDDATLDAWALDAWAARIANVHCRVAVAVGALLSFAMKHGGALNECAKCEGEGSTPCACPTCEVEHRAPCATCKGSGEAYSDPLGFVNVHGVSVPAWKLSVVLRWFVSCGAMGLRLGAEGTDTTFPLLAGRRSSSNEREWPETAAASADSEVPRGA